MQLYQLAEVRAKIGFVPFGHLVAAEQVSGMQEFLEERKLKPVKRVSRDVTSSTFISDIFIFRTLLLEQIRLLICLKRCLMQMQVSLIN